MPWSSATAPAVISSTWYGLSFERILHLCSFSHAIQAKKRTNVIPIIEDARHPHKYRMLVGMVDVIFADVAQPNQVC